METKLTLRLDYDIIQSAKEYAHTNNKSLSKLVEEFFRVLISNDAPPAEYPSLIKNLSGVISEKDLDYLADDDEKARHILRKER